jgi:hypothetical protein
MSSASGIIGKLPSATIIEVHSLNKEAETSRFLSTNLLPVPSPHDALSNHSIRPDIRTGKRDEPYRRAFGCEDLFIEWSLSPDRP